MHRGRMLAAALLVLCSSGMVSAESARDDYILHCAGCHLSDGRETSGIIPGLVDAGRFLLVPGGREFLIQVPGVSGSTLGDEALANLVNWLLLEFSPERVGEGFQPYTAAEVGRYRELPLADVERVRNELLADISTPESIPGN